MIFDFFFPGTVKDMLEEGAVRTLGGKRLSVSTDRKGRVTLNGTVKVITADLVADNGIFHEVDRIL